MCEFIQFGFIWFHMQPIRFSAIGNLSDLADRMDIKFCHF